MKNYLLKVENVLIIPKSYFKTIWHNIKVVRDIVLLLMHRFSPTPIDSLARCVLTRPLNCIIIG